MTRYKQAFEEMVARHKQEFAEFKKVHDEYAHDQSKWQAKFDELGRPINRIIWDTENRLCGKMEGSGRGQYTANLAGKFKEEVKKYLPLIDMVGIRVE
jgi:sugar-specific transcriptional regulator TrmB